MTDQEKIEKAAIVEMHRNQWGVECPDCGGLHPAEKTFVRGAKFGVAWRDQNPKPSVETIQCKQSSPGATDIQCKQDEAKLRDDVGPLYFVPWVSPRISREIAVQLNADLQHIRAQESARVERLERERDAYALALRTALEDGIFPTKAATKRKIENLLREFEKERTRNG